MPEAAHPPIYVHAAAALGPRGDATPAERAPLTADPAPLDLRELARAVLGQNLRQASHLVELAAVGSRLCLGRLPAPPPSAAAVYLGTGLAEVRKTVALFEQMLPPGPGLASPFDFINAANNMAAFYVAKLSGLESRNLTVTQEEFSFEWALKLALDDLRHGSFGHALVGGVDENSQPRREHLRRIALGDDQVMGEGSGWLYLSTDRDGARGQVLFVSQLAPAGGEWAEAIARTLHPWMQDMGPAQLLPGFRLTAADIEALRRSLPGARITPYLDHCGCYHTAAAFGIAAVFDQPAAGADLFVHINRNANGDCLLVGIAAGT